ncbi:MAG: hypothetical protein ACFFDK_15850 [Promethearchaeota archaeon]
MFYQIKIDLKGKDKHKVKVIELGEETVMNSIVNIVGVISKCNKNSIRTVGKNDKKRKMKIKKMKNIFMGE